MKRSLSGRYFRFSIIPRSIQNSVSAVVLAPRIRHPRFNIITGSSGKNKTKTPHVHEYFSICSRSATSSHFRVHDAEHVNTPQGDTPAPDDEFPRSPRASNVTRPAKSNSPARTIYRPPVGRAPTRRSFKVRGATKKRAGVYSDVITIKIMEAASWPAKHKPSASPLQIYLFSFQQILRSVDVELLLCLHRSSMQQPSKGMRMPPKTEG